MVTTTRLRMFRRAHGITLDELAKRAGFSNQWLSFLELGKRETDCVSRGKIKSGDRGAACRAPHRPFRDGKRLPGVWGAAAGTRGGGIR